MKTKEDLKEIKDIDLEKVIGGINSDITEEMKRVVEPLLKRVNDLYHQHFTGIHIVPTTYEEILFWNEAFKQEYNLLTPEEKRLVDEYIEIETR